MNSVGLKDCGILEFLVLTCRVCRMDSSVSFSLRFEVDRQYVFLSQWIELRVIVGLGVFPYRLCCDGELPRLGLRSRRNMSSNADHRSRVGSTCFAYALLCGDAYGPSYGTNGEIVSY